jgi:hypothetical protein
MLQIGMALALWGPPLWKLLHSMAERAGTSVLELDEIRAWISFLRLTEGVLPCAMCRAHYKEWRQTHPLEDLLRARRDSFRAALREWLWGLHNAVNARREIGVESLEILERYREVTRKEIHDTLENIVKYLGQATLQRQVNAEYVANWRRALILLRKFINY